MIYSPYLNLLIGSVLDLEQAKEEGIDLVVNVSGQIYLDKKPKIWEYISLFWHDTQDPDLLPSRNNFLEAHLLAKLVALRLSQGQKILIVCGAGLNRAALVAGLAMRYLGIKGEEVIRCLRMHQPEALHNNLFEKEIRDGRL